MFRIIEQSNPSNPSTIPTSWVNDHVYYITQWETARIDSFMKWQYKKLQLCTQNQNLLEQTLLDVNWIYGGQMN